MTDPGRPGIYLLASYPKSGNTWVRLLLEAWYADSGTIDINAMTRTAGIMSQELFEATLDIDPGELTVREVIRARPAVHRLLARGMDEIGWYKSHDANLAPPGADERPFPPGTLAGTVLIVRDPRDVAPSLADHAGCSLDTAIDQMADERRMVGAMGGWAQVPQLISSWSLFQTSWLDSEAAPVLPLRYEDLSLEPAEHLAAILAFAGLPRDAGRIRRAVEAARFDRLRRQEDERGFAELSAKASTRFFRHGRAGGWRDTLSAPQQERLVRDHGVVMARFGYDP